MSKKWIFTFGSSHLAGFSMTPTYVMLVVEADNHEEARAKVFESDIGDRFAFSYPYDDYAEKFKKEWGMHEETFDSLCIGVGSKGVSDE